MEHRQDKPDSRVEPMHSGVFRAVTPQLLEQLDRDLRSANERVETLRDALVRNDVGDQGEAEAKLGARALQEIDLAHEELRAVEEELHAQVDELLSMRETLEGERRRYVELFESAPEAYVVTDVRGCIVEANRRASMLFNLDAAFLNAKPFVSFVAVADRGRFRDLLDATKTARVEAELRIQPRKGEPSVLVALSAEPATGAGGRAVAIRWLVRGIRAAQGAVVEQEQTEERLRERVRELESTRRLLEHLLEREQDALSRAEETVREKDRILSEVAHELRSPLGTIAGWLRTLSQGEHDRGTRVRALASMTRGVRMLAHLAEDLCDNTRLDQHMAALDASMLNLNGLVIDVIEDLRPIAALKSVVIGFTAQPNKIEILGDSMRLQQVFRNLIGNATKFTPENGMVDIDIRIVSSSAVIAISDNGRGIARESLSSIFKPFAQVLNPGARGSGLGLGLSIAHRLVELHGGTVSAESEGLESGATFRVTLPLLAAN